MENQQQNDHLNKLVDCKHDKFEILLSSLALRLPSRYCLRHEEEEEGNWADESMMKTPRSSEPAAILECPPPPKKPRRVPKTAKRKAGGGDRPILMAHDYLFGEMELDFELLFPSNLLDGKIVKKVKRYA